MIQISASGPVGRALLAEGLTLFEGHMAVYDDCNAENSAASYVAIS